MLCSGASSQVWFGSPLHEVLREGKGVCFSLRVLCSGASTQVWFGSPLHRVLRVCLGADSFLSSSSSSPVWSVSRSIISNPTQ